MNLGNGKYYSVCSFTRYFLQIKDARIGEEKVKIIILPW